jgi:hypothetical protein
MSRCRRTIRSDFKSVTPEPRHLGQLRQTRQTKRRVGHGPRTPVSVLPSNWIVDWRRFHEVLDANPPDVPLNSTRKIDPFVVPQLHNLPGGGGSLPFRNLKRGVLLGLPSGQDVARAMRIPNSLTAAEIATGPDGAVAKKHGLDQAGEALESVQEAV